MKKSSKFLSLILSFFIIASCFGSLNVFAAENDDNALDNRTYQFDISDATLVQRYCAYIELLSEEQLRLYDVNFDGFVTIGDATSIQMHIAGLIDIHSEEYQSLRPGDDYPEDASGEYPTADFTEEITEEVTEEITEEVTEEITEETTEETTAEPTELATEGSSETDPEIPSETTYVRFGKDIIYMGVNENFILEVDTNAAEYTVSSSDESIVRVSENRKLTPCATGSAVITCTAADGTQAECEVYVGREVSSLKMSASSITAGLGESVYLECTPEDSGAYAANMFFSSSDENVAAVDSETGMITAVGLGSAQVCCELINGVTAVCSVTVKEFSETVSLNAGSVTAGVGEQLRFNANPESGKAVYNRYFYSEDENIVRVDKVSGTMVGVSAGSARIYCELPNGYRAYADVSILSAPKSIRLNASSSKIKVGDVVRLTESFNEGSYNTPYTLEWSSSDKAVSIEGRSGYSVTLKAKALGTAVITAKAYNGVTAKCTVTVSGSKVKCIDISSWQGSNVDFKKIKASGIDYVILRAGFGKTADNRFTLYYDRAKAAGLKIGSYWYMCANNYNESKAEAQACLKVLGGRKLDLPFYYDIEEPYSLSNNTQTELTNMAVVFCDTLKAKGYKVGTYASGSVYARNYKLNTDLLRKKGYSIWNAEWASSNTVACDIWQYADDGSVSGIDGNVDMDLIYNLYIED